jgi:hypothetical protein
MLAGFFIADFGIRNIWPVVALIAACGASFMLLLFIYERKRAYIGNQ